MTSTPRLRSFRRILTAEPRLAEPRIEPARILIETSQLKEAEAEVREAIRILENGGQWVDGFTENQVLSVAYGILAEVLRVLAEGDDLVFGDPEVWRNVVDESHAAFRKARELDLENAHADYWAGGLDVDAGRGRTPTRACPSAGPGNWDAALASRTRAAPPPDPTLTVNSKSGR